MKFSYRWLSELTGGLQVEPRHLSRLITMKTAESEGVEEVGGYFAEVCLARVEELTPLDGTRHVKAVVDAGRYGRRTVVCGAPNCRAGMVTAYVPPGTRLGEREIGVAVIDGVQSEGMLASGAELGINRDNAGILDISGEPGAALDGCYPDSIIEIDNKSLTHRPDLWGHYGMAREVAAITGATLHDPVDPSLLPDEPALLQVQIEDFSLCPRYSALVFENVTVQPSPLWLQQRLEAVGLNPINNIVDVTNYVMAELGQPTHAFDRDKLHGDTIYVRPAREGEQFAALNGEDYTLSPANLVIADAQGAVALAGVIGGQESAIGEGTRSVVLESANFHAGSIRKTSSRLGLRTDASARFEKSQDPVNTTRALARIVALLREVSPGIQLRGGVADQYRPLPSVPPITLPVELVSRKLGKQVDPAEVRRILESIAFGVVESAPGVFSVTVPSWRATKDISMRDDLVEEIGRMIGYDSITPQAPLVPAKVPPQTPERLFYRQVRQTAAAQGFTEVYNYSFVNPEMITPFGLDLAAHVGVKNPIAAGQDLLRSSLLPRLRVNIEENRKHFDRFRFFEIGREIHPQTGQLPREEPHFAAVVYDKEDGAPGLFELKRLAECLLPGMTVQPAAPRPYEHPARAVEVIFGDTVLGRLFELHPNLVVGRAAILDLDLNRLQHAQPAERRYQPIRRFPSSAFDLSVIADSRELVGTLQQQLVRFASADLEKIEYLYQYEGQPFPEGKKSVSFRLTIASPERTLSNDEVTAVRARLIEGMRGLGYELRV